MAGSAAIWSNFSSHSRAKSLPMWVRRRDNRRHTHMKRSRLFAHASLGSLVLVAGCSQKIPQNAPQGVPAQPAAIFKVDPATAASIKGTIHYNGTKPAPKRID